MKGQTERKLINIGFFVFIILLFLVAIRFVIIIPDISSDDICKWEYGENWEYDYNSIFGDTCVEVDYISLDIINRTEQNLTRWEALDKYCSYPEFWELSKWGPECKDE